MIFLDRFSRARLWFQTSNFSTTIPPTTTRTRCAVIDGPAAAGRLPVGLVIGFLAHQACLMSDAIVRTVYRKLISHKHLLEWVTAAKAEQAGKHDPRAFFRFMWPAEAIAAAGLIAVTLIRDRALPL